jgi:hypothetical protein
MRATCERRRFELRACSSRSAEGSNDFWPASIVPLCNLFAYVTEQFGGDVDKPPYCDVDMPPYCDVDIPSYWDVDIPPYSEVDSPQPCDVLKLRGQVLRFSIIGLVILKNALDSAT